MPKQKTVEDLTVFHEKNFKTNTVEVEELFKMMNDAGVTKNEFKVPLNKFMVEIKKNYEWNEVPEQPSTGAEGTLVHLVLG